MTPEKMEHFKSVAGKARDCEAALIAKALEIGLVITARDAAEFSAVVRKFYGDNTPPAPVDPDENIGS